jgi:hypothetical protein
MLTDVAKAPITRWRQSSTTHKVLAAGAGAGLAYYLHKRGMANAAVAVAGVAGAYAVSMVMHYPTVAQAPQNGAALPNGQTVAGALPPAQMQAMNQQAQAMMNGGALPNGNGVPPNGGAPAMSGGIMPVSQTPGAAGPIPRASGGNPNSKWSLLDMEM